MQRLSNTEISKNKRPRAELSDTARAEINIILEARVLKPEIAVEYYIN